LKKLGGNVKVDNAQNIIAYFEPTSKKFEHLPTISLQAHYDMVAAENSLTKHN
jgi:di/tripeptidase